MTDTLNVSPLDREPVTEREANTIAALRFYRDAWTFKTNKHHPGLEWSPKEELLDDCGNRARLALAAYRNKP